MKQLPGTKLCSRNLIKEINNSGSFLKWTMEKLGQMDKDIDDYAQHLSCK